MQDADERLGGKTVTVAQRDGSTVLYRQNDSIPLASFGSDRLPAEEIFQTN